MSEPHDLSVSFVLFNTPLHEVERAVQQVLQEQDLNCKIVIVDNSVPSLILPEWGTPRVQVIRPGKNLGYGAAHNLAFDAVRNYSRYHIVMNTDIWYERGSLRQMLNFMKANPSAKLSMPRVVYPNGKIQTLCRLLPSPADLFCRRFMRWTSWGRIRDERYELRNWSYNDVANVPFLSGCFMMLHLPTVLKIRGFDERFFLYAEDLDLSRRMFAEGANLYNPNVTITHEYRSKADFNFRRFFIHTQNVCRYFDKWGWFFDSGRNKINEKALMDIFPDTEK